MGVGVGAVVEEASPLIRCVRTAVAVAFVPELFFRVVSRVRPARRGAPRFLRVLAQVLMVLIFSSQEWSLLVVLSTGVRVRDTA